MSLQKRAGAIVGPSRALELQPLGLMLQCRTDLLNHGPSGRQPGIATGGSKSSQARQGVPTSRPHRRSTPHRPRLDRRSTRDMIW